MHRKIVHALLRLLDERISIHLPGELFRSAAHMFERLIDRHGADRHRGIAHDPLTRLVYVLAGRQVHDRVGAPQRRPAKLLHLFFDRRGDRGVADVGVDLDQKVSTDRDRFQLGMIDVGRDDGAPTGDFRPHELRIEPLAGRDELHLGRDDSSPSVVELRDRARAAEHRSPERRRDLLGRAGTWPMRAPALFDPATGQNPVTAKRRQAMPHVASLRTARVVDAQRGLAARQRDLTHRHLHTVCPVAWHVDLARLGKGAAKIRYWTRR